MSFSFKVEQPKPATKIDWDEINEQIEEGPNVARISLIVDLGIQEQGKGVAYDSEDDYTIVESEEQANALIEEAAEIIGDYLLEKNDLDIIDEVEDGFKIPFRIYKKSDRREVAIFADLVDTRVEYVKGEGEKQYRVMLNSQFKGDVKGISIKPTYTLPKSNLKTFDPKSKLAKLAKATGHKEILKEGEHLNDIGRLLGEAFYLNIEKENGFIKPKDVMPLPKGVDAEDLDNEPVGITFENATVELLEKAYLRRSVIEKIKKAKNYEGSNIQKAIEEWEAKMASNTSESDSEEDSEETSREKGRVRMRKKASEKPSKAKPEPEIEEDDDFEEDDIPW